MQDTGINLTPYSHGYVFSYCAHGVGSIPRGQAAQTKDAQTTGKKMCIFQISNGIHDGGSGRSGTGTGTAADTVDGKPKNSGEQEITNGRHSHGTDSKSKCITIRVDQ